MPEGQRKSVLNNHFWMVYLLSIILLGFIWYFQWMVGIVMTVIAMVTIYLSIKREHKAIAETEKYIKTLSHRVRKVGEEALLEMPIGILLFNDDYDIEWANPFLNELVDDDKVVGSSLHLLHDEIIPMIKEDKNEIVVNINDQMFKVVIKREERLLYLFDCTGQYEIETRYQNEKTVLAMIFLDNYEEITQNADDTWKSQLNSRVTEILNHWAHDYGLYLKRISQERFVAVGTMEILSELEKTKFSILDDVREINTEQNVPLTISIGFGYGYTALPPLGELAQSGLDLALGRGGDQVAIKDDVGKVRFYGGKTNPMEKRTRVRARVISHAMKELVRASENVIIMGHKSPDMDSLGAAIGILNIAQANDIEGYIVFDQDDVDTGVHRLVKALKKEENLWQYFIQPEEAEVLVTNRSLVVVVDTHKPSMVADAKLLNKTELKVIIDHHRRAEEFISNPTLVYMEPYASSTAELVTELLEYQPKTLKLNMLEASSLLAGIIVDTKSFTLRTGSRTFDAASYLRSKGADTVLVQQLLKEDLQSYLKRSKLIERTEIYSHSVAIAKGLPGEVHGSVLIAQTADTLLSMTGIAASFVISDRDDGRVGISARSLGEVNVQVIMEQMQGGGHLTNAATQLSDIKIDDAEVILKNILTGYFEGGEPE